MGSPRVNIDEDLIIHPESSRVNNLINLLPFEIHSPGYHFCGPGTRLKQRLEKGEKGINPLDDYCRKHDVAYANSGNRTKADCLLAKRAIARLLSETATTNERSLALVTTLYIKKII